MTQKQRILSHLMQGRTITDSQAKADDDLRVGRLSDVIFRLRNDGHDIATVMRQGQNKFGDYEFAEYHLIKLAGR